jgi:hypothetical protein
MTVRTKSALCMRANIRKVLRMDMEEFFTEMARIMSVFLRRISLMRGESILILMAKLFQMTIFDHNFLNIAHFPLYRIFINS